MGKKPEELQKGEEYGKKKLPRNNQQTCLRP